MEDFVLYKEQTIPENISRVIIGQIDLINSHCSEQTEVHISIHEIRKGFKRIRAVLRLIRDDIGYGTYYRENIFYRDLARSFSGVRDFEVLKSSLELVERKYPEEVRPIDANRVRKHIIKHRDHLVEELIDREDIFTQIGEALTMAQTRTDNLIYSKGKFSGLRSGMGRIYRNGRKMNKHITRSGSLEDLHDFRKRSKYLYYNLLLFENLHPGIMKAHARTLKKFTDNLGDSRDIALLGNYLINNKIVGFRAQSLEAFIKVINEERFQLIDKALTTSGLIYAEKTGAFVDRLEKYWKVIQ